MTRVGICRLRVGWCRRFTRLRAAATHLLIACAPITAAFGNVPACILPVVDMDYVARSREVPGGVLTKTRMGWTVANCHQQVRGPIDVGMRRSLDAKIARLARGCDLRRAA